MKRHDQTGHQQDVLDPTEARQASPRKDNFRVLLSSLSLAVALGIVLVAGFWTMTPTAMDYSSGGKLQQTAPTPQTPEQKAPAPSQSAPSSAP